MRFFPVAIAAVLDLLSVGAFVAIGRASHAEAASLAGFLGTAWPFAVGLVAGWAAMRAWRHPMQVAWTGVGIWLCTVVPGLARPALLTPGGAPLSFAVVHTVFLARAIHGRRDPARPVTMVPAPQ